MYRILYHGTDKVTYTRLKDGFPSDMRLEAEHDWDRLKSTLVSSKTHGIILPLNNPGPEDYHLMKRVISLPGVPGVIVTATGISAAQAVCCMRHGAFDCLTGPVNGTVMGACLYRMIGPGIREESENPPLITGSSREVSDLLSRLKEYAGLPYPLLITGETGTGKELAARTVHRESPRRDGPLVAVNCAAFSDDLLGSEMFGSKKGAFTGSVDRPGLIESADGGTLFLDEIGELSIQGQACLLRVIEERTLRRLGSNHSRQVDVRVIAATNRNLQSSIRNGQFRADLYYRINLLGVTMPPLRKRRQDIPEIARKYLVYLRPDVNWRIEAGALAILARYGWPGNVRELQSVLLKATLSARNGIVLPGDIRLN